MLWKELGNVIQDMGYQVEFSQRFLRRGKGAQGSRFTIRRKNGKLIYTKNLKCQKQGSPVRQMFLDSEIPAGALNVLNCTIKGINGTRDHGQVRTNR